MENHKILRRDEVLSAVGLKVSWLYSAMARGEFPRPVRLTGRNVGWRSADVAEWLASRETA